MPPYRKDLMLYHYHPKRRFYLVSMRLENQPGALGNLANILGIRGMNILEGYFGGVSASEGGVVSFFLESTNPKMDSAWLKQFLESAVLVSDVSVKEGAEGFLFDSLNFPLTLNTGERAVAIRVDGLRAMLEAVEAADPAQAAQTIYSQGFSLGASFWESLMAVHRPLTPEGLTEVLQSYTAAGWGVPQLIYIDEAKKKAKVDFTDSFECYEGRKGGAATSHFLRGHLAGAMSVFFQSEVGCTETKCVSKGDSRCEFEAAPTV